jgi:hypothetical protein
MSTFVQLQIHDSTVLIDMFTGIARTAKIPKLDYEHAINHMSLWRSTA